MSTKTTLTAVYQQGNVIVDTRTLKAVITDANAGTVPNRSIDPEVFRILDPEGLHVLTRVMLHNDVEWRCLFYIKVIDSLDPLVLWQDVPLEVWTRVWSTFSDQLALLED